MDQWQLVNALISRVQFDLAFFFFTENNYFGGVYAERKWLALRLAWCT
jgi:hypothetical protein